MYSVIKKDGRVIEFDIGKISEAIQKAFAAVEPVPERIDAMVEEAVDNLGRVMYSIAHSLAHWVLHVYFSLTSRIIEAITFDPCNAARLAIAVQIRVRLLTVSFLEHAYVCRVAYLLRTQDRGTDENSDSDKHRYKSSQLQSSRITINKGVYAHDCFRKLYRGLNGRVYAALYLVR